MMDACEGETYIGRECTARYIGEINIILSDFGGCCSSVVHCHFVCWDAGVDRDLE